MFEVYGIIISKQGSGRYAKYPDLGVQIKNVWSIFIKYKPTLILDFLEVRKYMEISSIPVAMNNLKAEDLLVLRQHVNAMLECVESGKPFIKHDRDFHCALFSCIGNTIFEQLLTAFWDICESADVWPINDDPKRVAQQHIDILEAFACRDQEKATSLLEQQFMESRNQIALALVKN